MKALGAGLYADEKGDVWYFSWSRRDWCRSKRIPNVAEWERRLAIVDELGKSQAPDKEDGGGEECL